MAHSHAVATDALVAAVLLVLSTLWLVLSPFTGIGAALLQAALIVPLLWRRSYPAVVFLTISVVAFAQWFLRYPLIGDASLLVALYTVAVHESRRRALLAAGILELGAALASTRWVPAGTVPRSFLFLTATVVAALFAGLTVRSGSEYMGWLAERAGRLEIERDQQKAIGAAGERTRIAREIHDIVAHSLSVVITLADAAAVTNPSDPARATETMRQASDVGRQALNDMRTVLNVLRTEEPNADLDPQPDIDQLDRLYDRIRATGLDVLVVVEGDPFPLGAALELTVFRILQEALTNTIKHSSATAAHVKLHYQRPFVEMKVSDNGTGSPSIGPGGHGITGMRERAALHGGLLEAGPVEGGGWRVTATLCPDPTVSA
ncbi:MAG TPA: sensor histidine kinase [Acidimicrobiales bacterium]|nr:sensor histidine kinase [Acidimicrobiales bacterium]